MFAPWPVGSNLDRRRSRKAAGGSWAPAAKPRRVPTIGLIVAAELLGQNRRVQLGGDRAWVTSLISNPNVDPHDYEPTSPMRVCGLRRLRSSQRHRVRHVGAEDSRRRPVQRARGARRRQRRGRRSAATRISGAYSPPSSRWSRVALAPPGSTPPTRTTSRKSVGRSSRRPFVIGL